MKQQATRLLAVVIFMLGAAHARASGTVHNVVLFVPDGLRSVIVDSRTAPTMSAVRDQGINFRNSHSLFPTFTTANASAFATGHYLGDTGDFSNTLYLAFPVAAAGGSIGPFLESDAVLGEVDEHFAGNYLGEVTVLEAARKAGYDTASIGKQGPTLIQDHTERTGQKTVIIDDATGTPKGIPVAQWVVDAMANVDLKPIAPDRGESAQFGNATVPGTHVANIEQQDYFTKVLTDVVLPKFKRDGKPFVVVFWSRDPDGAQHYHGDSLNTLTPGINGPTSLAAIKNADNDLARIREALGKLELSSTTDVIVSADHGFTTISKQSATSSTAKTPHANVPANSLPQGFLAMDLSRALNLPLWDPDQTNQRLAPGTHPKFSNGVIGIDPARPSIVVAGNGGSDLLYLPRPVASGLMRQIIDFLLTQDYVSGLFVDSALGEFPGTLPLSAIALVGRSVTPLPSIVVNFRSFSTGCAEPLRCTAEIADSNLTQGQGMHGSFSRAETKNFMAAIGPDFKAGFIDDAPASNADIGRTIARILGLDLQANGNLVGRVLSEAMPGGVMPHYAAKVIRSRPSRHGLRTVLEYQVVGETQYFDAAGFPGRTVGLGHGAPARSR